MKINEVIFFVEGLFLDRINGKVLIPVASNHETKTIYFAEGQWECYRISKKKKIKWWKAPLNKWGFAAPVWKLVSFKIKDDSFSGFFEPNISLDEELERVISQIELFFLTIKENKIYAKRTVKKELKRIGARRLAKRYCTHYYPPLPYKQCDRHNYSNSYIYLKNGSLL